MVLYFRSLIDVILKGNGSDMSRSHIAAELLDTEWVAKVWSVRMKLINVLQAIDDILAKAFLPRSTFDVLAGVAKRVGSGLNN